MRRGYQLRFNLGRGDRYMKWKVTYPSGAVRYFEPSEVTIIMQNCKLINKKESALRIFNGANKYVVAWVEADYLAVSRIPDENVTNSHEYSLLSLSCCERNFNANSCSISLPPTL